MRERVQVSGGGVGFCGLLTIVFIVLKLTDVIGWSWLWVLSPLWIPFVVVGSILLLIACVVAITAGVSAWRSK